MSDALVERTLHSGMDKNQHGVGIVDQFREKGEESSLLPADGERQSLGN